MTMTMMRDAAAAAGAAAGAKTYMMILWYWDYARRRAAMAAGIRRYAAPRARCRHAAAAAALRAAALPRHVFHIRAMLITPRRHAARCRCRRYCHCRRHAFRRYFSLFITPPRAMRALLHCHAFVIDYYALLHYYTLLSCCCCYCIIIITALITTHTHTHMHIVIHTATHDEMIREYRRHGDDWDWLRWDDDEMRWPILPKFNSNKNIYIYIYF